MMANQLNCLTQVGCKKVQKKTPVLKKDTGRLFKVKLGHDMVVFIEGFDGWKIVLDGQFMVKLGDL